MKAGLLKYGQPKEDVEKTIENAALFEMGRLERGPRSSPPRPTSRRCSASSAR
jgi:hypothetical protein